MHYRFITALPVIAGMLLALSSAASPARAYDSDQALETVGTMCTKHVTRNERRYGIPSRLLGAIAATETGRRHQGLGIQVPWPWAINVEGAPYFFHTKAEAVAAVQKFQAQGKRSIDVGCMQVNLRHHPHAFANLNQAFEPSFNVEYAARFLRSNFDEAQSWKTAVGYYHSRTPHYASRYINNVYRQWYGLSGKAKQQGRAQPRYTSFIRNESTGEQVTLVRGAEAAPRVTKKVPQEVTASSRVVKIANHGESKGRHDLSLIRPTQSAGVIKQAPIADTNVMSSPLVVNGQNKSNQFRDPRVVVKEDSSKKTLSKDSVFIQFSE